MARQKLRQVAPSTQRDEPQAAASGSGESLAALLQGRGESSRARGPIVVLGMRRLSLKALRIGHTPLQSSCDHEVQSSIRPSRAALHGRSVYLATQTSLSPRLVV